jgi:hypothetical protein
MGVPVYRDLAEASGVPFRDISLGDATFLLGNSMHAPTVGCVIAVVLACVQIVP